MAMLQETFAQGNSVLHRRDPRLRVVFAALYAVLIAVSKDFTTLIAGLCLAVIFIFIARLSWSLVARRLVLVNIFNLILAAMLPFTFEGQPLYTLGPFVGSAEGLQLAGEIALKSNALVLIFITLVTTMSVATLGHALNSLHVPQKLVYLLLIAYRYVFVLEQEYGRLATAARVRGFSPGTNLHSYKTVAYLFGMLLVRALARADRVYRSMLCRGFQGRFYCIHQFRLGRGDLLWSAVMLFFLLVLVYCEWLNVLL